MVAWESQDMYVGNEDTLGRCCFSWERPEVLNCTLVCLCASPCSFLTHPRACPHTVLLRKLTAEPEDCSGRCAGPLHDRPGVCSRDMAQTGSKFQPAVFSCIPGQGWDTLLHVEAMKLNDVGGTDWAISC